MEKRKAVLERDSKAFDDKCHGLGIDFTSIYVMKTGKYRKEWSVFDDGVTIPKSALKKLEDAQALYDVGKQKEAKGLCDELIKEYKIGGFS